jgi:geranylgeranyl diphosphate synthase type II
MKQKQDLDYKQILAPYKELVDKELARLILDDDLPISGVLKESVSYSILNGGKRLRAILSLLSAEAVLKQREPMVFGSNPGAGLALAVELVHCGSLIHDDLPCMDDDDLRRGKATNHKVFGEANALLAGDFLMVYPLKVLADYTPMDYQRHLGSVQIEFLQAICDMIQGQALDLELSGHDDLKIDQVKKMDALKTGALLKASILLPAKLAGVSNEKLLALDLFATNLGLAFQIIDDVLDCSASTDQLGKTSQKDIKQNKHTYVKEYGVDKSKQIAWDLIDQAKQKILDSLIYADKLNLVADYVISRNN